MMAPPNRYNLFPAQELVDMWERNLEGTNRFHGPLQISRIKVGPPEAELVLAELPAGHYNAEVRSEVRAGENGRKYLDLKFKWLQTREGALAGSSPAEQPRGTIFLLHGYLTCKEIMLPWAFLLAQAGYDTVLVDLRGHGQSQGDVFSFGLYESGDLTQALDQLEEQGRIRGPLGVLGFSFGANLGLLWAARDPRVEAIVAIAPYNQPDEAFPRFVKQLELPISEKVLRKAMRMVADSLHLDWSELSGQAALGRLQRPVFFIGAGRDGISPPSEVEFLGRIAPPGSCTAIIPEASHDIVGLLFHELAEPVKEWFDRNLHRSADGVRASSTTTCDSAQ